MPETFFAPGQQSHCVFSPDLWCDKYNPTESFAPFEFLSDIYPQTVGVVLPAVEGPAGEIWDRVYKKIEEIWQSRQIGFRCARVTPEAFTQDRPCEPCLMVRDAQVVIIDHAGGDARAGLFREMAALSRGSLEVLKAFGPAPMKRVILIGWGPMVPSPLHQKVFDWIDYTGSDGQPDLEKLGTAMEALAREGPFQAGEEVRFDDSIFEAENAAQPSANEVPVLNTAPPEKEELTVKAKPKEEFTVKAKLKEELTVEAVPKEELPVEFVFSESDFDITILETTTVVNTTPVADEPVMRMTPDDVLKGAETLVKQGQYSAALIALKDPDMGAAKNQDRLRELERECIANMRMRELTDAYFRGLTGRQRHRFEVSDWNGEPASAKLTLQGEDFSKRFGTLDVALYVCDRLETSKIVELRKQLGAQRTARQPALIVVDGCNETICRNFAELRGQNVFEIHLSDLRRWALGGKPPVDALRERLRDEYRRPDDLFRRGVHGPVVEDDTFFGRADVLSRIEGYLRSGDSFVVHGLSRSGKSSLLWRLSQNETDGRLVAVIDTPSDAVKRQSDLYLRTARAIREAVLANDPGLKKLGDLFTLPADATLDAFRGRFETDVKSLADRIRKSNRRRLVLLFDQIPSIASQENRAFLTQLQNLAQEGSITVGLAGPAFLLQREMRDAASPLRKMQECILGGLGDQECAEMVRRIGHRMYSYFEPEAIVRIAQATGGHPMLVRHFCSVLLEALPPRTSIVTEQAVADAVEPALGVRNLRRWLARISDDVQTHFPAGADLLQAMEERIDPVALAQKVGRAPQAVAQDLEMLSDYGLVAQIGTAFRPRIGLLTRFMQQKETEA